jgi:hypothetical protein
MNHRRRVQETSSHEKVRMARWPRHIWTSIVTYVIIFGVFPLLCFLAWAWVRGRI